MFIKFMCLEDCNQRPIYEKIKFNKLFPNVKINSRELDYYIYGNIVNQKYKQRKNWKH